MPTIRVDEAVYRAIRSAAPDPSKSCNVALRNVFDLGPEPKLYGEPARLVERNGHHDHNGYGVTVPVPDDAPWRECVLSAWRDSSGRLHMDYA